MAYGLFVAGGKNVAVFDLGQFRFQISVDVSRMFFLQEVVP